MLVGGRFTIRSTTGNQTMKRTLLVLLSVVLMAMPGFGQRIAFVRGKVIYVGDLAGKVFKKSERLGGNAAKADDLQLCSDGMSVAYTLSVDVKHPKGSGKPDFERYIELSRLDGSERARAPDTQEQNSFGPRWSPDKRFLAFDRLYRFSASQDLQWRVTIAGRDLKDPAPLRNSLLDHGFFVYAWTPDGHLAVMGNDTLNVLDRSGALAESTPLTLDTLGGTAFSPSSADILSFSPDGQSMLWILTGADDGSKNFAAIYDEEDLYGIMMLYDRTTKTLRRISPKSVAMSFEPPVWLSDGKTILFTAIQATKPLRKGAHPTTDLFTISIDGSGLTGIAPDAHVPVLLE